jgi:hypothetical protein
MLLPTAIEIEPDTVAPSPVFNTMLPVDPVLEVPDEISILPVEPSLDGALRR